MSNLSWLTDKEFSHLLVAQGFTEEMCLEAAKRFEALVDKASVWDEFADDRGTPEEVNAAFAELEEDLHAEEQAHEATRQLYNDATDKIDTLEAQVEDLKRELNDIQEMAAQDERTCCNCGERL